MEPLLPNHSNTTVYFVILYNSASKDASNKCYTPQFINYSNLRRSRESTDRSISLFVRSVALSDVLPSSGMSFREK